MESNADNEIIKTYGSNNRIFLNRYYTENKNERQTYDLVFPKSACGSTGLILCIHGGGWVMGDRYAYRENILQACDERGLAAAAINYRYVSETVCFDDLLDDITAALAAIRAEGEACGVSFDRVLLTGSSAGGHLSLLYAYSRKKTAPIRPVCVVELCGPADLEHELYFSKENGIAQSQGLTFLYGLLSHGVGHSVLPEDLEDAGPALRRFSPVHFIDKDTVPTVFGHGDGDTLVPYQNALDLDAKLTAFGVGHTFVPFPGSGHGCENKDSMAKMMALFFRCAEKYL